MDIRNTIARLEAAFDEAKKAHDLLSTYDTSESYIEARLENSDHKRMIAMGGAIGGGKYRIDSVIMELARLLKELNESNPYNDEGES